MNWFSASKKFIALLLFVGALLIVVVMFGLVVSSDAGSKQREFGKKRRYDATQCVAVDVEQMIVKKKFLAAFCRKQLRASHPDLGVLPSDETDVEARANGLVLRL